LWQVKLRNNAEETLEAIQTVMVTAMRQSIKAAVEQAPTWGRHAETDPAVPSRKKKGQTPSRSSLFIFSPKQNGTNIL
jgi:hypothetical protein